MMLFLGERLCKTLEEISKMTVWEFKTWIAYYGLKDDKES